MESSNTHDDDEHGVDLCMDLLSEVFSRISSLQVLGRCRVLSDACNRLTYESSFITSHCLRTKIVSGFVSRLPGHSRNNSFVPIDPPNASLSLFFSSKFEIKAATSHGILLCFDWTTEAREERLFIGKPSTKQWRPIPYSKTTNSSGILGMSVTRSNPLQIKIVSLTPPKHQNRRKYRETSTYQCQLFDSDVWAWKRLEPVRLPSTPFLQILLSENGFVSACGSVHQILRAENVIFALDLVEEKQCFFPMPGREHEHEQSYFFTLAEVEGKLALWSFQSNDAAVHLWVMENYKKKLWVKRQVIGTDFALRKVSIIREWHPVSFYGSDVVVMRAAYNHLLRYRWCLNFKNGDMRLVDADEGQLLPFSSDFERFDFLV